MNLLFPTPNCAGAGEFWNELLPKLVFIKPPKLPDGAVWGGLLAFSKLLVELLLLKMFVDGAGGLLAFEALFDWAISSVTVVFF
jgi:hypothetical protein